ncbi:MAG: hypothetical protein HZA50_02070 [Planctomycetes bacterium]|nr:hypothetical protein [Planctomycetota bacterium]
MTPVKSRGNYSVVSNSDAPNGAALGISAENTNGFNGLPKPSEARLSEVDLEGTGAIPEEELARMARTYGFAEG